MGNRLSRIITRTGDAGSTGLATGDRVPKTHARIAAMGEVDELNSLLGLLLTHALPAAVRAALTREQHALFDLGGELSLPGAALITDEAVARLEAATEALNEPLPPLKEFILPGGNAAAAVCHLARSVARRVERSLWALHELEPLNTAALRYTNRLSDLLFVAARTLARVEGGAEVFWQRH